VPFSKVASRILGTYDLSIVFVTPQKMRSLNRAYGRKDASTDVLAFPLAEKSGELFFSLPDVEKKAAVFGLSAKKYFEYLLVHGLVHLKGLDHGRAMATLEKKYCKAFGFSFPG
jgi:probable rRNA maturation factor